MLRDPRDSVTSKHGRQPDRYWASLRYWKAYTPEGRKLHPNFTTVRYEDFVKDPGAVQEELIKQMPFLEKRAPFSWYHEVARPSAASLDALGGLRPISPVGVGNWRNNLPRLAGQIQIHSSIAADLIEYGYENDDSWLKELAGVQPDTTPGVMPEHFTKKALRARRRGRYKEALWLLLRRAIPKPAASHSH
jgi:hypothetical protein